MPPPNPTPKPQPPCFDQVVGHVTLKTPTDPCHNIPVSSFAAASRCNRVGGWHPGRLGAHHHRGGAHHRGWPSQRALRAADPLRAAESRLTDGPRRCPRGSARARARASDALRGGSLAFLLRLSGTSGRWHGLHFCLLASGAFVGMSCCLQRESPITTPEDCDCTRAEVLLSFLSFVFSLNALMTASRAPGA